MKRRLMYALAAAAVALGIAAGLGGGQALAGQVPIPPDTEPPGIVAPESAWRGFGPMTEKSLAISDRDYDGYVDTASRAPAAPGVVLAGFKTRAGGTEIAV